jgi:hypothetical protein
MLVDREISLGALHSGDDLDGRSVFPESVINDPVRKEKSLRSKAEA